MRDHRGRPNRFKSRAIAVVFAVLLLFIGGMIYRHAPSLAKYAVHDYYLFTDRKLIEPFIRSFGAVGPVVFILLQIAQVLVAPLPGEITGIIGGYLFGPFLGFIYSIIGLSVGSWINILIGRLLGKRFILKFISKTRAERLDRMLRRQGVIVIFILFIIPGFPKDYLCFFMGMSSLSIKILVLIASVGRAPATLLLTLEGAALFEKNYGVFWVVIVLCLVISFLSYHFRQRIYTWVENFNHGPQ